jgi:uncharacterized protein with PIN domain
MAKMKILGIVSIEAACGKCGESLEDPRSGSFQIVVPDVMRASGEGIKCPACGAWNDLPASITKFGKPA